MKKYKVTEEYSGYVRGERTYEVLANSEEEALENYMSCGIEVSDDIIRNDTSRTGNVGVYED